MLLGGAFFSPPPPVTSGVNPFGPYGPSSTQASGGSAWEVGNRPRQGLAGVEAKYTLPYSSSTNVEEELQKSSKDAHEMVWLECPALREFLALALNSRYLNVAEELPYPKIK